MNTFPEAPVQPKLRRRALVVSTVIVGLMAASTSVAQAAAPTHSAATVRTTAVAKTAAVADPSGAAMPVGDIPGWRQIFADDFTTDTSSFPGPYADSWTAYGPGSLDGSGHGKYTPAAITVHDGEMDIHLTTPAASSYAQVAAPVPMPAQNGTKTGQIYGRYSIRFKSDSLPKYKTEWNLWPDDNNTSEGKIDFPQGDLGGSIVAIDNTLGAGSHQGYWATTHQPYTAWHTATIEWLKTGVTYFLDGAKVGFSSISPTTSLHWVLQTETQTGTTAPPASEDGHVVIDWATEYAPDASNGGAPAVVPGAPRTVTATAGDSSAAVNWTTPITNGGAQLTGYTVTATPGGATCTTTTTTCTVPGLTNGYSYTFTARATNSVGAGTVSAATTAVTPLAPITAANPSGAAMPVGDTGGWHQVYAEDFNTAATTFPTASSYAPNWTAYAKGNDTTGEGAYSTAGVTVHNGTLDINLHSVNGVPQVAAPVPTQPSGVAYKGQLYGAYTVRFKSDSLYGYKTAWMLWPDNNTPADGEIDFPEGDLDGTIGAYNHTVGAHSSMATAVVTPATYQTWHTATIQWLPSGVSFYLDGNLLGHNANSPSVPMHWILQTETSTFGHVPSASENGHVDVDWAAIYSPTAALLG